MKKVCVVTLCYTGDLGEAASFKDPSDKAIDLHVKYGQRLPCAHSTMHIYPINGAAPRVAKGDTAFSFREASLRGGHRGPTRRTIIASCNMPRTTGSPCTPSRRAAAT